MYNSDTDTSPELSSKMINAIENVAINIAAQNDGNLYSTQLMPYFSLSLRQLDKCLLDMVDNSSILKTENKGISYYKFKNLTANNLPNMNKNVRDSVIEGDIRQNKLEHQVIHTASHVEGKVHAASIAANTDFTLSEVKSLLEKLNLDGFISENLDEENGSIYYLFPKMVYPEKNFKINMHALLPKGSQESFDMSMAMFTRYMFTCIILLVLMFFAKVNFRFLVILFLLSMPLSAMITYYNSKKITG
jgi:hypothetical protein